MVTSLRHVALVVAVAGVGACFVEPPPVMNETDTTGLCEGDQTACSCMSGSCVDSSSSASASEGSTQPDPDTSGSTDAGPGGETHDDSTSDGEDVTSDASESGTSTTVDSTGTTGDSCKAMACAECISCVDTEVCEPESIACDGVAGCETAVACLVNCGLGIDCLDNCCADLDETQLMAVNALVLCKSDECVDPCDMVAELDAC